MESASSSTLGKHLLEEITPVVVVVTTPLAEESCQKNGLNFVQLLRPFTVFDNIDVPVRTANDQPYRLQSFRFRLIYASDVRKPDYQTVVDHLRQVVDTAATQEVNVQDFQSDPPRPQALLSLSESEVQPSWFHTFNRDLRQAVSFSDHETFDHPVACLFVASSEDDHAMKKFVDLSSTDQISFLNGGAMDSKIFKHYILLHDMQHSTTEKASGVLAEMRSTLGLNESRILCINSVKDEVVEWKENPWLRYANMPLDNQNVAGFLGIDDFNEVKELMQDLASKKIIPYMEQKIRILNQQVSATRKGFRNQIKNLWWRKGKEELSDTPKGPMYTSSSNEYQIRLLADYAFMLRDYELAVSNYRLLSTDYKLDKAWKHYAGVQEMMGLSLFLLDQSRKDSEYCMDTAFNTYLKIGTSALTNATRCGLWWAEMLKARGQLKEAASVFSRISNEEPSLHAAILLEQAAYCYLFSNPPMLRKFGFHLILAGNCYHISDQRKHAIRTYRTALSVYGEDCWSCISNRVHFNIGRWYAFLEMFDAASKHMLEVLECFHQSLATQDLFLKDFLQIVQKMGRKLEIVKLQLPSIHMSSLKVIFEDRRTYASSASVHVRESIWHSLEENMVPSVSAIKSNWLESQTLHPSKKYSDGHISMIGETIKVFLQVKNPLQISIPVSGMCLVCESSTKTTSETLDEHALDNGLQDNILHGVAYSSSDKNEVISFVDVSELNFVLEGGEMREVQLDVTPKSQGFLKIVGVKWTLCSIVTGYFNFDINLKRKERKGKRRTPSPRQNLAFIVVKGVPKLDGYIHHMPRKTYNGDMRPLVLELRNQSEYSMKNMKMKISDPRYLIPGNSGELVLDFPDCLKEHTSSEGYEKHANPNGKSDGLLFSFPSDAKIHGGAAFQWPLWLHTPVSGKISLYISIYYEMDNFSCDVNYRTLRMHYELEVLPSLDISITITPCTSKLQEFLVLMEISSRTNSESFWLRQLSSVGRRWEISPLPAETSICPSQLLLAGQALLCLFKLKDHGEKPIDESKPTTRGSNIGLGAGGNSEVVFDVTMPLMNFHDHERLHSGNSHQDPSSTADFILISQLVENDALDGEGKQIQLLSHHACDCSINSKCPVWWLMNGPQTICHDFSSSFYEANFSVTVHNCSDAAASVKITTFDTTNDAPIQSRDLSTQYDSPAAGWHDISLANEFPGEQMGMRKHIPENSTPYIWCASSSTHVVLQPMSTAEIPVRICLFSPGIYDLSSYEVHWCLQFPEERNCANKFSWESSGSNRGLPFYLTVLQSAS